MKNVFLKSLKLHFFKGTKKREIIFKDHQTDIAGPNGSGKTTIFDAFTWLLFGKDSHDKKDFNIKTLESNGKNIEKIEHTVEGTLVVDGKDYDLKRVYKENWVKTRGELEATLKGHETLFYINEVPRKAGEYAKEIDELIDESLFKLITNPKYFASLNWKNQREILFTMAGSVSDAEIAAGNSQFENLLVKLSGKSLENYKIEISSKKKKLKDDLNAIPTRVDEAENAKPQIVSDFSDIEHKITILETRVQTIDDALEDASKKFTQKHEANQSIRNEINDLKTKQNDLVFNANSERRNQDFQIKSEKQSIENEIQNCQNKIKQFNTLIDFSQKNKTITESKITGLRDKYKTVYASEYTEKDGTLTCPVYNIICDSPKANELHRENASKTRETFNNKRVEELETINNQGIELKEELAAHDLEIENVLKDIQAEESKITELQRKLITYPNDDAKPQEITGNNIPEWGTIQKKIEELQSKISDVVADDNSELKNQKREYLSEIDSLKKQLAAKEQITRQDERIATLNQEGRKLAQMIADLEKDEFAVDAFNKAKIEECESRVNGKFKLVSFKLFTQQLNGGESETCEMMINGVPYSDANTASQINAGLDVINVLSKFHGVTAPIFIDNRESVTNILDTESQIVNLLVTNDKELIIK